MKKTVYSAGARGGAEHGWLKTKHSFSFGNYYDPKRMGFGTLRVLNDDVIAAGKGFSTHPHSDMEIITIVSKGELIHRDSTGAESVLRPGDVQVMSAGRGIHHSEHNNSDKESLELFQLWITPNTLGVEPRHEELRYEEQQNRFTIIASGNHGGISIHQDALVAIGTFTTTTQYKPTETGSYLLIIHGRASINGHDLTRRDAIAIRDEKIVTIEPHEETRILLVDTSMNS